jgi:hypothetical protein
MEMRAATFTAIPDSTRDSQRQFRVAGQATQQWLCILYIFIMIPGSEVSAAEPVGRIVLVNPFPAAGPHDINGSTPANKVLRAMQDHAPPYRRAYWDGGKRSRITQCSSGTFE